MIIAEAIDMLRGSYPDPTTHPTSHLRHALQWAADEAALIAAEVNGPGLRYPLYLDLNPGIGEYRLPAEVMAVKSCERNDIATKPVPLTPLSMVQRQQYYAFQDTTGIDSMFWAEHVGEHLAPEGRYYWVDNRVLHLIPVPQCYSHRGLTIYTYCSPRIGDVDEDTFPIPDFAHRFVISAARVLVEPPHINPSSLQEFRLRKMEAESSFKSSLRRIQNDIGFQPAIESLT